MLVWIARFCFFPFCRDARMLLLGFSGAFLFLAVFNHCLILEKVPWLTYGLTLFDLGVNSVYLGVVFEITSVIVWEVTTNPNPFGFDLHSYAQRMKAGEEIISILMKLGFFYSALLILGFNLLNVYSLLSWELFSRVASGILVGSIFFLLAGFRYRLRGYVSPVLGELEQKLENLLAWPAPEESARVHELFYLKCSRQLLLNSIMIRWQPEDVMMIGGSLLLFVAQPVIGQLLG